MYVLLRPLRPRLADQATDDDDLLLWTQVYMRLYLDYVCWLIYGV